MPTLNFVCLANSRKLCGRCIAGKVIETGEWVRPVGSSATGELSELDRRFQDGTDPQLLQLLNVETLHAQEREDYQTENHQIDSQYYWTSDGTLPVTELEKLIDQPGPLWHNGSSTYHGQNDRVPSDQIMNYRYSLRLVSVPEITISVFAPSANFGNSKRKVYGSFVWAQTEYKLIVTDPVIEKTYLSLPDEDHVLRKKHYLTVSLGEPNPHDGHSYKLIAAIICGE